MKVNVAVVSHGHSEILRKINCLPELSKMDDVNICVVDNVGEKSLYEWCKKSNIHYLKNERCRGFGENNNIAFKFFKEETDGDFLFLVMNPDIYIDNNELEKLKLISLNENIDFATINLYKDYNYRFYDFSVRKYPAFVDFAMSILFGVNKTIVDKNSITKNTFVDWASGSFFAFYLSTV
ncbi:glycosyltransferase [Cronobacter sakazakii]|nr:glycosyltransferase [Cronobacter sakazakii]MDQ9192312.1 glycosyltransferase [Cronobacter sakazakii]